LSFILIVAKTRRSWHFEIINQNICPFEFSRYEGDFFFEGPSKTLTMSIEPKQDILVEQMRTLNFNEPKKLLRSLIQN
jgi:hypothetical protein